MVKQKIAIASSMAAVAVFLVGMLLLLNFLALERHDHIYDFVLTRGDDGFVLSGKCTVEGCEEPDYYEKIASLDVSETVPATCMSDGKVVYTAERKGESVSYTEYLPKLIHTVGGVAVTELFGEDGVADFGTAGVVLSPFASYNCGGVSEGEYTCDVCHSRVSIGIYKAHHGEFRLTGEPNCTEDGLMSAFCVDCGEKLESEQKIDALGHIYEYSLDGAGNVVCDCTREGCPDKVKIIESSVVGSVEGSTANCTTPSSTIYTFVMDGKEISFTVYGECAHVYHGDKVVAGQTLQKSDDITILSGSDGFFICEECGQFIGVRVSE